MVTTSPPDHDPTTTNVTRGRSSTLTSVRSAAGAVAQSTIRAAETVFNADPPLGAWAATAQASSTAPTLQDIRESAYGIPRRNTGDLDPRRYSVRGRRSVSRSQKLDSAHVEKQAEDRALNQPKVLAQPVSEETVARLEPAHDEHVKKEGAVFIQPLGYTVSRTRTSGWVPPPKLPWTASTWIGFKWFLRWNTTPLGFFITLYSLNVVAWGGMLFLLLCNASPAMCMTSKDNGQTVYDCNDLYSPRRVWIEIDSQILNALFCVTGFGLIPWRFRDLFYLLRWRLTSLSRYGLRRKLHGLRTLAGINRTWLRLPGSDTLDELPASTYMAQQSSAQGYVEPALSQADDIRLPIPLAKAPAEPLTGIRAPPTALWKLDFFIWCQIANTALQAVLCYFMWRYDRFARPSWATGLFIALACIVAGIGGIVTFREGKKVKRVEGYQPSQAVMRELEKRGMGNIETQTTPQHIYV